MLVLLTVAASTSSADEEAAMHRMLTLQQRSLVSDRPLQINPLPFSLLPFK